MKLNPTCLGVSLILGLAACFTACSPSAPPPPEPPPPPPVPPVASHSVSVETVALERGREIIAQAGKALSGVLLEAVRETGYTNALPLCSLQAIPLTQSLSDANGVTLRRISHKARNPVNQADAAEMTLIKHYQGRLQSTSDLSAEVRTHDNGPVTFYAPIVLRKELCLNCHGVPGKDLRPELVPILNALYADDQATGFQLGELRGLWRIDFPSGSLNESSQP